MTREEAREAAVEMLTENERDRFAKYPATEKLTRLSFRLGVRAGYDAALSLNQWVPVAERLPENAGDFYTTIKGTDKPFMAHFDGKFWLDASDWDWPVKVVAWHSLPEPYKPQEGKYE